jgi:5-formyltetrahydrofolate cyclo-ligase
MLGVTQSAAATLKREMRAALRAVRARQDSSGDSSGDGSFVEMLAQRVLGQVATARRIAAFYPLPGEIDLRPLMQALHARGQTILLPQTPPRGQALIFRAWHPGCAMLKERFGTYYPDGPIDTPDTLLVPLLGFDRAGNRLGYGGGYYDRTLARLPGSLAIGIAYAAQEVPHIPAEPHDRPLDAIATEREFTYFSGREAARGLPRA